MKCRLIRFWIGCRMDDTAPLPRTLERHLEHCAECSAWRRSQRDLIRRLRHSVPVADADPPPLLRAKIMRALEESRPQPQTASWLWPAGAATAAVIALLIVLFSNQTPQPEPRENAVAIDNNTAPAPGPPPAIAATVRRLPVPDGTLLLHAAAALDQPLQREITLLREDALTALRSLKTGFVPEALLSGEG